MSAREIEYQTTDGSSVADSDDKDTRKMLPPKHGPRNKQKAPQNRPNVETVDAATLNSQNGSKLPDKPQPKSVPASQQSDEVFIVGRDEPDNASMWSVFMDKDPRYYFQHPYCRLFIAYFVVFCNFLIYAEDPVAHSYAECNIPVIGHDFAFVCTKYPPNAWSLLKVFLWLMGTLTGILFGKFIIHKLLFNRLLRLKMFSNDQGSWMIMFLCTVFWVFVFANIYNGFLLIGNPYTDQFKISGLMSLKNSVFLKAAAVATWCGDFFTAWMVTDMMLQEHLYPKWALPVRGWWKRRYNRIILFWAVVIISSALVIVVITTDVIRWDRLNRDFLHTNELGRAFLASFILVCDVTIILQDWDFPHFISSFDIKLPGLNTSHIHFKIPKILNRLDHWNVHINGKWFNYGILFVVMLLDLNMWKNQIFYQPPEFAQYVDTEGRILGIKDDYSLDLVQKNTSLLTYAWRSSTLSPQTGKIYLDEDVIMNARFRGTPLGVKCIALIPSIAAFILMGVLIFIFGRFKPSDNNPYAGRLKKRRRKVKDSFMPSFKSSLRSRIRSKLKLRQDNKMDGVIADDGSASNVGGATVMPMHSSPVAHIDLNTQHSVTV